MLGRFTSLAPFAALLSLAACARTQVPREEPADPHRTRSGFPTKLALEALREQPPPALGEAARFVDVPEWTLEGPFPEGWAYEPHPGPHPWAPELAAKLQARPGLTVASTAMHCVARELARFQLVHDGPPSLSLLTFIGGRCKAPAVQIQSRSISGTVPGSISDEELYQQWKGQLAELHGLYGRGFEDVGLAFRREGEKVVFVVAAGQRKVHLTAVSSGEGPAGRFVVEGEVLEPAESLRALVNRGRFSTGDCAVEVALPKFRLACDADPGDPEAWIELASFPANRVLGTTAALLLVSPAGDPMTGFVRSRYAEATLVASAEDIILGLDDAINRMREDAGLAPLAHEPAQSALAAQVAPFYFAATTGALPQHLADTVALGMRAGWQVNELVRYGLFTAAGSVGTNDLAYVLASAVERPFGREVVLDPHARRISIGSMWVPEHGFAGAVISTYALFDEEPASDLEAKVAQRISRLRSGAMRSPPQLSTGLSDFARGLAASVHRGERSPGAALNALMSRASTTWNAGVRGWVLEGQELDELELPPELAQVPQLEVALAVSVYRPADEPWGRYVVLLVWPDRGTTAARSTVFAPVVPRAAAVSADRPGPGRDLHLTAGIPTRGRRSPAGGASRRGARRRPCAAPARRASCGARPRCRSI